MARLVKDAAALTDVQRELGIVVNENDASFGNIVNAISVVQAKMGIMGATSDEAGKTIQGSVSAMKSAWTNLITGLADSNADIESLVGNLVTTIVGDGTEENLGVLGNIMPAVKTALGGASNLFSELLPTIVQEIPAIINDNLPILAEAAINILQSFVDGIEQNQEMLITTAFDVIVFLANSLISMLPQIVKLGLDLIISLANGIAQSIPKLVPTIVDVVIQIVEMLTDPETLNSLLDAAMAIVTALSEYLISPDTINLLLDAMLNIVRNLTQFIMDNLSPLLNAAIQIIMSLVHYLLEPENIKKLLEAAVEMVVLLAGAMIGAKAELAKAMFTLVEELLKEFAETDWEELGRNIIQGMKNGLQNAWKNLKSWFEGLFDDIISIAKKILGIASPSKVFKKIGGFTAEGFGLGFEDEFANVKGDMEDALNFDDPSVGINSSIRQIGAESASAGYGGTTISGVEINIYADQVGDSAESIADAVAVALQDLVDRRSAVYA